MREPITPPLSNPIESIVPQEYQGMLMQNFREPSQIGQQITQIIRTSPDGETVLLTIAQALGEIFQVDACLIVAQSSHNPKLSTAFWGMKDSLAQAELLEYSKLPKVKTQVEPLAVSNSQSGKRKGDPLLAVQAILSVSTWFQHQQNGVVLLGRSQPYAWSDGEKEMFKATSEAVAIALAQVNLSQQAQAAAQHQSLLSQMTAAIRSSAELDHILQLAIAGTAQALQVDRGLLLTLKYAETPLFKNRHFNHIPKAKATVVCEWSSVSPDVKPGLEPDSDSWLNYSFWLSECHWCQKAFKDSPEAVIITDQRNPSLADSPLEAAAFFEAQAMPALLMVPLESHNTLLGFLVLQHRQPRPWQPEELDLVNWISAQTSTAIIQNETLRQVQALVEERTVQLQRSLEVQAKLYEKTRRQIDQLRHLNQIKDEFLSTVSHELRTPLTSMAVAIRMLRQSDLPIERRAKYLDILEQQCNQEIKLINDLLALQQMESKTSPIQLDKIDLKQLIQELVLSFEQKWAEKGLTLAVDLPQRSLQLQTDSDSLNRILQELLTNAGKYSEPNTTVHLQVNYQVQQPVDQIVLTLANKGSGISPAELTYIFDKFRRGQGVTQKAIQGTGLGLALVKSLVQHLNGTIEVSSCPTDNTQSCETCFTLTLPQFWDNTKV
jgi:signal transduction histidine kinase